MPPCATAAEVVALRFRTALILQEVELGRGFHAFRHDTHVQTPSHVDDRDDDAGIIGIVGGARLRTNE